MFEIDIQSKKNYKHKQTNKGFANKLNSSKCSAFKKKDTSNHLSRLDSERSLGNSQTTHETKSTINFKIKSNNLRCKSMNEISLISTNSLYTSHLNKIDYKAEEELDTIYNCTLLSLMDKVTVDRKNTTLEEVETKFLSTNKNKNSFSISKIDYYKNTVFTLDDDITKKINLKTAFINCENKVSFFYFKF